MVTAPNHDQIHQAVGEVGGGNDAFIRKGELRGTERAGAISRNQGREQSLATRGCLQHCTSKTNSKPFKVDHASSSSNHEHRY